MSYVICWSLARHRTRRNGRVWRRLEPWHQHIYALLDEQNQLTIQEERDPPLSAPELQREMVNRSGKERKWA